MTAGKTRQELSQRFENFVERFLKQYVQDVQRDAPLRSGSRADFVVSGENDHRAIVEAKLYTSLEAPKRAVLDAILRLRHEAQRGAFRTGVLITNARIDSEVRELARSIPPKIEIYDYDVLERFCLGFPLLSDEFQKISELALSYRNTPVSPPTVPEPLEANELLGEPAAPLPPDEPAKKGAELCTRLRSHPKGRGKAAVNYENLCLEILKYVLDDGVKNWRPQKRTTSGLHIFDAIARVASDHDFWQSVAVDFRARYIIFEFKNYSSQITQAQVYSTEKYLLPLAMRGMGIILSRKGASKNAFAVMAGALRESGKLLLCLDDDDLCEMLRIRDEGGDTTAVISEKLDALLESLDR